MSRGLGDPPELRVHVHLAHRDLNCRAMPLRVACDDAMVAGGERPIDGGIWLDRSDDLTRHTPFDRPGRCRGDAERQRLKLAAECRIDEVGGIVRRADDRQRSLPLSGESPARAGSRESPVDDLASRATAAREDGHHVPLVLARPLLIFRRPERQQAFVTEVMPVARRRWRTGGHPLAPAHRTPGVRRLP